VSRRAPAATERLSALAGSLARARIPGAAAAFARLVGADVDEAEFPVADYPSVLAFFTRRLRPGARPVDADPSALVSPVDGSLSVAEPVGDGRLVQSKDRRYPLADLLVDAELAEVLLGGSYATLYLSPRDYHRIHAPVDGRIVRARVVPGGLWPVNDLGVRWIDGLFVANRRVVVRIHSPRFGRVAVVMVGATNVGAIRATFDPSLTAAFDAPKARDYDLSVARGDELGVFELGSTVIVVTERPVRFTVQTQGDPVRMGRALGSVSTSR
jgi:phosphatidylserine decarboxylase